MSKEHNFIRDVTVTRHAEGEFERITVDLQTSLKAEEREWLDLVDRLSKYGVFPSIEEAIRAANTAALMDIITRARNFIPEARIVAEKTSSDPTPTPPVRKRGRKPKQSLSDSMK